MEKLKKLKTILKRMGSVLVAYSGGVDSTLLLKVASDTLGNKVLAVTATSATYPKDELILAKRRARLLGVRQRIIKTGELQDKQFRLNSPDRCYFCKHELFSRLKIIARENKIKFVADGSNLSDKDDFRPGSKAKKELRVRSPLAEAGLTKQDVRRLSKRLKLSTWDKPSLACLASRIPYGTDITYPLLEKIERAEGVLKRLGFDQVRLRHYNGLCRIEVSRDDLARLLKQRNRIVEKLKRLGYNYITLDLEGYRSGSMNEVLK